jgi:U3 small nucleolar RNA-associated protein MPP10
MELAEVIEKRPQELLVPNEEMKQEALKRVKESFEPIASKYSIFDSLHVDGLDAEQVWTQAQMIVDGVVESLLGDEIPKYAGSKRSADEMESDEELEDEDDGEEVDFDQIDMDSEEQEDEEGEEEEDDDEEMVDGEEAEFAGFDEEEEEEEEDEGGEEGDEEVQSNELDDEVFKLEDFQKQVLDLEKDNGGEDDDEEIDYFGELQDEGSEPDDYKYEDFFDPPKKSTKNKTKPEQKKKKQVKFDDEQEEDGGLDFNSTDKDVIEAMESMKKDMFESESEDENEDEEGLSRHEQEAREIAKQIKQLEEENVAEKHWAVKGEVKAKDRPDNSLLETELNFERTSKPVPVVTQEFNDSIEELIKKRIMNYDFDDLPRRLPDTLPEFRQSKLVDVQETKSQKSLAELYEEDFDKANNPEYKSAETQKLEAAHQEVVDLYGKIAFKLDALCSWHYTPKAPKPTISIVSNAPTISMEEAQPTTASNEAMLAPQEVYRPEASNKREIIGRDGLPVAKSEMTREERKRARRREKTKHAKQAHAKEEREKAKAQKTGSKADVMQTLKKSNNVTVIGKHGEKRDLTGNLKKEKPKPSGQNLKL